MQVATVLVLVTMLVPAALMAAPRAALDAGSGHADLLAAVRTSDRLDEKVGVYLVSSLDARTELLSVEGGGAGPSGGKSGSLRDNPVAMMLASLTVPGSSQLIRGESRGYLYMLFEAALWGGFFALDQKGLDERDDYERFADEHWDADAYYTWFDEHCSGCSPEEPCGYECRPLAEYGTQEYYEDIGKYDTYWGWWSLDGHDAYPDGYSDSDRELRDRYYEMRGDSNRHLRQARYALMAALLNHVVSAIDAFVNVRADEGVVTGEGRDVDLEFDVTDEGTGLTCTLVSRY